MGKENVRIWDHCGSRTTQELMVPISPYWLVYKNKGVAGAGRRDKEAGINKRAYALDCQGEEDIRELEVEV